MSALTEGWLTEFGFQYVENPRSGGSTYDPEGEGYPYRIVWHTTESDSMPNTAAHQYPPQLWASYEQDRRIQTIPLTRAGFALYQASGAPYYTNRARAIQVEIVGRAEAAASWPEAKLRWLAEKVALPITKFVEAIGGRIDFSDQAVPLAGPIPNSAREDAPQRLQPAVWAFGPVGMVGHRHVPMGDDHWDAGGLDTRRFRDIIVATIGGAGYDKPIPTEPRKRIDPVDMKVRRNLDGTIAVYPKGTFGINDSPVIFYDAVLVSAGSKAVIGPTVEALGKFQVVPIVASDKEPVKPLTEAGWGAAHVTLLKTDSWVTFAVPERATPDKVQAYIL